MSEEHQSLARTEATLRWHTRMLEKIMSVEDDLKAAIAENATAMHDAADVLVKDAEALAAAVSGDSDADVGDLANQLKANTAQFKLALANAKNPQPKPVENTGGAANPAPAPAPAADNSGTQAAP